MKDHKACVEQLLGEIRTCDFSKDSTTQSYDWLISKAEQVLDHLRSDKATQSLQDVITEVPAMLRQYRLDKNPLIRERIISTQQDIIVYHLTVRYFKRNVLTGSTIFFS